MSWEWTFGEAHYDKREQTYLSALESDLKEHMAERKPGRYAHTLSVANTCEQMALAYGVDPFLARAAGILHDWDKVLSAGEQVARAEELGINLGVDGWLVQPLLHGMTAAAALPERYPELSEPVWQAIARHTIGAVDMTELDMVVFVADGIEPRRKDVPAIRRVRELVEEHAPLTDVFWSSFSSGVAYVIETERYLFPGTLDIYNELVLARRRKSS